MIDFLKSESLRSLARFHPLPDIVTWADANYRVQNNDAEFFQSKESPWLIEPMQAADDPLCNTLTFVKPVQTGGTSLGEIILLRNILRGRLLMHYNWPTDEKAEDRWKKFTERRIKACLAVKALMPSVYEDCFVSFTNGAIFAMQGVYTTGNLDSDTVDLVINEEVHQYNVGMIAKARGRQTRVTFPKFITISNAGIKGSDLHTEFANGTQQRYQVKCPGCGQLHVMRTRWEDSRPELGGLRYDSEGCKRPDNTFNYNKLLPTIRYQFPCGFEMRDEIGMRKAAAAGGRYQEPENEGALASNRSFTYEAVSCHNIRWLDLIQEKHAALRALRAGDDNAFRIYCQERESVFYDPSENRPVSEEIILNLGIKKNREGMAHRKMRLAIADWQQGFKAKGELTHYWLLIVDYDENCNQQIVFEGAVDTDAELVAVVQEYEVKPSCVWIDASKNTKNILSFCYREGFSAVSGILSHKVSFMHEDKVRRFFSAEKPICAELNVPPRSDFDADEPVVLSYNKSGLISNHFFIRDMKSNVLKNKPTAQPHEYISVEIPADVSEDFKKQNDSWERVLNPVKKSNDEVEGFRKIRREDHLLMCRAYGDMILEWSGLLGNALARMGIRKVEEVKE